MDFVTAILTATLRSGTSLVYATVGETYTERSGILNLGLEGMMMMGGTSAFIVAYYSNSLALGLAAAMLVGGLMAALHAFLTVTMRANQVVSGLSLTLFGTGFASFLGKRMGPADGINPFQLAGLTGPKFSPIIIPWLSDIPVLGALFRQDIFTYAIYIIIPLAWFYLYKTKNGLNLRAVGDDPQTADAMGVKVFATKYLYTILGGMLVGLGGAHLSLSYTPGWSENITGGRGWIVIALVIFSMWNPSRAIWGALIFGGITALQLSLQAQEVPVNIPAPFLSMMPYLMTILVLVAITWWETLSKHVGAPASLGKSYMREDK